MDFDTVGAFVDNSLMVFVARHKPDLENAEDQQWAVVAEALQKQLSHPVTEEERVALRWIDVQHYNAAVCQHRAQYNLWRARKQKEESKSKKMTVDVTGAVVKPSDFNILKDSLKSEVDQLMSAARGNLPSAKGALGGAPADSDDEDDDAPIEVYRPPTSMVDDVDPAQAEAEAALLQKVQDLQLDHYRKYKKWVETHIVDTPIKEKPSAGGVASSSLQPHNRSGLVSDDAIEEIPLDQLTTVQVGELLEFLDLSEHKSKFRRTTGKLLLQLKKEDIRERFGTDFEGADILWTHVEENRVPVGGNRRPPGSSPGRLTAAANARRIFDDVGAPSATFQQRASGLREYESQNRGQSRTADPRLSDAQIQEGLASGDLSALKRSLNPNRPARPSARVEAYDYSTSEDDAAEIYGVGSRYMSQVGDSPASLTPVSTPEKSRTASYSASAGAATGGAAAAALRSDPRAHHVDPAAKPAVSAGPTSKSAAAAVPSSAPARSNRWQIMEYDDDEDSS